ncbi:MAG: MotA/TolQ/ExbB proton channel family protein [Planctomycetota bacterium]
MYQMVKHCFCLSTVLVLTALVGTTWLQADQLPENGFAVPDAVTDPAFEAHDDGQIVASKRLTEVLISGGPLMIPIMLCSFVLVVFTFERLIALRKGRIIPGPFTRKFLEQLADRTLDKETAVDLCEKDGSVIANVFRAGILKWGKSSVEVEQAVLDEGERQSNRMRRYLRLINGIATVCPLLGLLGTVLGMIHAFDAISTVDASGGDPKIMIATGISQALLTTAAGMTVAIPALIAYLFFTGRVDLRVMEIDSLSMKVVHAVCAESQIGRARTKTSKKAA